jgi:hypothetical protein
VGGVSAPFFRGYWRLSWLKQKFLAALEIINVPKW